MNILFPVAEAAPLYKIGGLGDVGGALPKALFAQGLDVRIILPQHPEITDPAHTFVNIAEFDLAYAGEKLHVIVYNTLLPGSAVPVYLIHEPKYLSEPTGASDNHANKFSVFSLAVATWVSEFSPYWQPHVIHCHDWHTALIPVILEHKLHCLNYKTIITVHNLAYQGITTTPVVKNIGFDPQSCQILSWDGQDGDINILLEGLLHCDFITTVSPTYAQEILTQEYGEKIEHIVEVRAARIKGILNGVDTDFFNPQTDAFIPARFDSSSWTAQKALNRQELRRQLKLPHTGDPYLISFVGRVDPYQKGIGLIIQAIKDRLLPPDQVQFVFLGTGDPALETQLHQAGDTHPNIRIITRFDEPLAHQIYAASHLTLIPSRFEPCGLVQLIAMRYGSLPIARATGGLIDTISSNRNGFLFTHYTVADMVTAIHQALTAINDPARYSELVHQAMEADYSWHRSAAEYAILYEDLAIGQKS